MATLIRKRRAPMTAASKATVSTALQVRTLGQISKATSWAIPEQTKKFIARLCKNDRPCRAAAAPTTSPNAMMPGVTGSPCRNPTTKPDQPVFSVITIPRLLQWPGLSRPSTSYRIGPKTCQRRGCPAQGRARRKVCCLKCSGLRLRGDLAGWRLGTRARLAGRRHRRGAWRGRLDHRLAHGPLACKQIGDLVAGKRLELEQSLREHLEVGTLLGENLGCLGVSGFDETADFAVDLARSLLGNVLLTRDLIAEENLVLVLAISNRAELIRQAPARHHHARELCRLLDIRSGPGSHLLPAEHHFLRHASAHHDRKA